jgi:hypothetical protein
VQITSLAAGNGLSWNGASKWTNGPNSIQGTQTVDQLIVVATGGIQGDGSGITNISATLVSSGVTNAWKTYANSVTNSGTAAISITGNAATATAAQGVPWLTNGQSTATTFSNSVTIRGTSTATNGYTVGTWGADHDGLGYLFNIGGMKWASGSQWIRLTSANGTDLAYLWDAGFILYSQLGWNTDNANDFGYANSGLKRPRDAYIGRGIILGTNAAVRPGVSGSSVNSVVGGTNFWVIDIGGGNWQTNHVP